MSSFLDVISSYQRVSKFFGFTVFMINREELSVHTSILDKIWLTLTSIYNILVIFVFWNNFNSVKRYESEIMKFSMPIILSISLIFNLINLIANFLMRHKIGDLLFQFVKIDKKVSFYKFFI